MRGSLPRRLQSASQPGLVRPCKGVPHSSGGSSAVTLMYEPPGGKTTWNGGVPGTQYSDLCGEIIPWRALIDAFRAVVTRGKVSGRTGGGPLSLLLRYVLIPWETMLLTEALIQQASVGSHLKDGEEMPCPRLVLCKGKHSNVSEVQQTKNFIQLLKNER